MHIFRELQNRWKVVDVAKKSQSGPEIWRIPVAPSMPCHTIVPAHLTDNLSQRVFGCSRSRYLISARTDRYIDIYIIHIYVYTQCTGMQQVRLEPHTTTTTVCRGCICVSVSWPRVQVAVGKPRWLPPLSQRKMANENALQCGDSFHCIIDSAKPKHSASCKQKRCEFAVESKYFQLKGSLNWFLFAQETPKKKQKVEGRILAYFFGLEISDTESFRFASHSGSPINRSLVFFFVCIYAWGYFFRV